MTISSDAAQGLLKCAKAQSRRDGDGVELISNDTSGAAARETCGEPWHWSFDGDPTASVGAGTGASTIGTSLLLHSISIRLSDRIDEFVSVLSVLLLSLLPLARCVTLLLLLAVSTMTDGEAILVAVSGAPSSRCTKQYSPSATKVLQRF